jgi:hypothetical protein
MHTLALGKVAQQRSQQGYTQPLTTCRSRLVFHFLYGLVGAGLLWYLSVPRCAYGDGSSLPGVEGFGRHWLLVTLTRLAQPRPCHTLQSSQPSPQPFSELRGRDPDVVGMAATVKYMKCLGATSLALEQLPLHKRLSCRVHKAGRKTHRVHRLSNAFVTSLCLKPMGWLCNVSKMPRQIKEELPSDRGCDNFLQQVF